jgi:APA family basic amino acid/polyamine antiporter
VTAPELRRALTFLPCFAVVVGGMLGTGVYLRSALMAQQVGSAPLVLAAWAAAGALSMAGALTYAELAARLPRTGGEYVFLHEAFGARTAFVFGWTRIIVGSASQAAVAVAFATFLSTLTPALAGLKPAMATAAIVVLTTLNCLGIVAGGRAQTVLTTAKVVAVCGLIVGALVFAPNVSLDGLAAEMPGPAAGQGSLGSFGAAMLGALWAYAGWANLPMAAGEVIAPERTLPRAIVGGALAVTAIYVAVNAMYFLVLPFEHVATANSVSHPDAPSVGARAAQAFLGREATSVLLVAFAVSAFGTLNSMLLTTARIGYAMARDGWLPAAIAHVSPASGAPVVAIAGLGALTIVLALMGSLDRLATGATLGYWVFHVACGLALFILRRRDAGAGPSRFRVPGFPVVPGVFVAAGALLVGTSFWTSPIEARWVSAVVVTGMAASRVFRRKLVVRA